MQLLRQLWTQKVVNFAGEFEQVQGCGINPLPVQQPIPLWLGGSAEPALKRAAVLGDGFFTQRPQAGGWKSTLATMRAWREEAGQSWESFGIEARVGLTPGWEGELETWRELGATHVYLSTLGMGLKGAAAHLERLHAARNRLDSLGWPKN